MSTPKKRGRPKKGSNGNNSTNDDFDGPVRGMTERQQIKLLTQGNTPLLVQSDNDSEYSSIEESEKKHTTPKKTPTTPTTPKKQKELYIIPISCRGESMGQISITPQKSLNADSMKSLAKETCNIDRLITLEKLQKINPSSLVLFTVESDDIEKWKRIYSNFERDNVAGLNCSPSGTMIILIPQTEAICKFFSFSEKEKLLGAIILLGKEELTLLNKKSVVPIVQENKPIVLQQLEMKPQNTIPSVLLSSSSPSVYHVPSFSPLPIVTPNSFK
jgi:hypothetical protein